MHHDVWVRVCRALAEKPFQGHFRGWLFAIARHLVIDRQRSRRKALPLPDDLLDQRDAPPVRAIRAEERDRLERCLKRLDQAEARMFRLRSAGADYTEACQELGIDVKVGYRLFEEAKRKLTGCVQKADT